MTKATKTTFRTLIKAKGLTQSQAAKTLGLSLSSIDKRLSGKVPVRMGELLALASLPSKSKGERE